MPPVGAASSRRPCPRHASGRIAERLVVLSSCRLVAAVCVLRSRAQGREKWGFWWFPVPLYTYIASLLKKKHSRKHSADTSNFFFLPAKTNKQTNKTTTMTTTPPPPTSLFSAVSHLPRCHLKAQWPFAGTGPVLHCCESMYPRTSSPRSASG